MKYRLLGRTGLKISEVSFGTIPLLRGEVSILPSYYNRSIEESLDILEYAYSQGINLFDTALTPEYGDSEFKVGLFAQRHPDIVVSDKARRYDYEGMSSAVMSSLKTLHRDSCDIYFVHQVSPENRRVSFGEHGAIAALVDLRDAGAIRFVGVATHHWQIALEAARDSRVDVIQFPGNVFERGFLDGIENDKRVFADKGILVCKAFAAGALSCYFSANVLKDFVLSYPVSSVVLGFGSKKQISAAILDRSEVLPARIPLDTVWERFSGAFRPIRCVRCQRCRCSKGFEIVSIFRYYNYYMMGQRAWAYDRLLSLPDDMLTKCINCTQRSCCMNVCPSNIDIQGNIVEVLKMRETLIMRRSSQQDSLTPGRDFIGVGVGAVIIRNDHILLLLRNKSPERGFWSIPGGKVEFGETVEEALVREIKEEIGVEARIIAPLGVTNHILREEGIHFIAPRFLVSIIGEPQNMEPSCHREIKWFPLNSLPPNITLTTKAAISAFITYKG